ncbi:MAG: protein-disulfide reductase DsbD domain-containing protein [Pseudomonadota bacterium]
MHPVCPPQLSFAGSKNIIGTKLRFPAPTSFGDGSYLSAGYTQSVTLPIAIEPLYANKSVMVKTQGLVGICSEICVPVQFSLSMDVGPRSVSKRDEAAALFAAKASLPGRAHAGFSITDVMLEEPRLLHVKATIPENTQKAELFVTPPDGWYLTPASAKQIDGRHVRFELPLNDIPTSANAANQSLTMTLVADGVAVEQVVTVSRP